MFNARLTSRRMSLARTICLLSSSITITLAVRALRRGATGTFSWLWLATILLGLEFLIGTGFEWYGLIYRDGLTIDTNLLGTTFYSLVGFHAAHVTLGLLMLSGTLLFVASVYIVLNFVVDVLYGLIDPRIRIT